MKKNNIITILLIFFIFCNSILSGQNKKNSISLNGSVARYLEIDDFRPAKFEDSYKFPLSLGVDLVYWRQCIKNIDLGIGVNYQKVHFQAHLDNGDVFYDYMRKFQYQEISIPLHLRKKFLLKNKNQCYITLGGFRGKQLGIRTFVPDNMDWQEWKDNTKIGGYSKDYFFTDIYLDAGYSMSLKHNTEISIAPFLKYRVNTTWVNTYQYKPIIGVKLNYSLKF